MKKKKKIASQPILQEIKTEAEDEFAEIKKNWKKLVHSLLYYFMAIISLSFMLFCGIQGFIVHSQNNLDFAWAMYIIASILLIIAYSSFKRGKRHFCFHDF